MSNTTNTFLSLKSLTKDAYAGKVKAPSIRKWNVLSKIKVKAPKVQVKPPKV